jgi:hypothetical protein
VDGRRFRMLFTVKLIKGYRGVRDGEAIDFGVYGRVEEPGRVRVGDRSSSSSPA